MNFDECFENLVTLYTLSNDKNKMLCDIYKYSDIVTNVNTRFQYGVSSKFMNKVMMFINTDVSIEEFRTLKDNVKYEQQFREFFIAMYNSYINQ